MSDYKEVRTAFLERAGIKHGFFNAGMSEMVTPAMVAAVSNNGGMGVIPAMNLSGEQILDYARQVRALTDRPFAIEISVVNDRPAEQTPEQAAKPYLQLADALSPLLAELELPCTPEAVVKGYDFSGQKAPSFAEQFNAVLEAAPAAVISACGGFREDEADRIKAAGILNIGTVTTLREAKVLATADCDALIVQGAEASGVRQSFEDRDDILVGLLTLVPAAARVTGLPIFAAGGISSAEQVRALETLGAAGVVVGTALLTTQESQADDMHRYYAQYGTSADVVMTRLYHGRYARVLNNGLIEAMNGYESIFGPFPGQWALMGAIDRRARELGRNDLMVRAIGQSIGSSAYQTVKACMEALFDGQKA